MECIRATLGGKGRTAFAQLRPTEGAWPHSGFVNVAKYDGDTGLVEGKRYIVAIAPESKFDDLYAELRLSLLDEVWPLADGYEVEFHRLTRAVLRPGAGPYEITPGNAWGKVLAKALPKNHPVWQFIKVR